MGKSPADTMMRIAIAGSGGLAQALAHYINETVHALLILSRQVVHRAGLIMQES